MYTHSYSFNTYIRLSVPLGCLIKQAGIIIHTILNMWERPEIERVTSGLTVDKCISNQQLYQLSYSPMRSSLCDERISDLVLLSHERQLTSKLDIDQIIDDFSAQQSRRI